MRWALVGLPWAIVAWQWFLIRSCRAQLRASNAMMESIKRHILAR